MEERAYDKFWNRVMFPIMDVNNRVIGFGGRVMGDGTPKYLNSPETMIFDKSRNLYGLNYARPSGKNLYDGSVRDIWMLSPCIRPVLPMRWHPWELHLPPSTRCCLNDIPRGPSDLRQ